MNNAIGKWTSTTCWACFAKIAALISSGCNGILLIATGWSPQFFSTGLRGPKRAAPLCHGSASSASLHHHFRRHLRMNRAKVVIRTRLRELEAELVVGVEGLRLEHAVLAHHGVGDVIAIDPSHLGSGRHGDGLGRESKVVDLYLERGRRLLCRFCAIASDGLHCDESCGENDDSRN